MCVVVVVCVVGGEGVLEGSGLALTPHTVPSQLRALACSVAPRRSALPPDPTNRHKLAVDDDGAQQSRAEQSRTK